MNTSILFDNDNEPRLRVWCWVFKYVPFVGLLPTVCCVTSEYSQGSMPQTPHGQVVPEGKTEQKHGSHGLWIGDDSELGSVIGFGKHASSALGSGNMRAVRMRRKCQQTTPAYYTCRYMRPSHFSPY